MWRANLVLIAAAACFVTLCQSEEVQVGSRTVQARFLGTLNRYYVSYDNIEYENVENSDTSLNTPTFVNDQKHVAVVVHGRQGSAYDEFTRKIHSAFRKSEPDTVVIMVEWALVASMSYETAFNSVPFVADDIISFINRLGTNIDKTKTHLIGFDIGAHIVGIVSRDRRARVQRVTGLSPAGQNWDTESRRLRNTDAEYVEAIHTDYTGARAFGIGTQVGTVDIFANAGTSQPGCTTNQCNHDRAWDLFAASLEMGGHLVAFGCGNTIANMTANRCSDGPAVPLGTNTLFKQGSGIYRVNTGRVYPYNL